MRNYFRNKRKFPRDTKFLNSECCILVPSAFKCKLYFECPIVHRRSEQEQKLLISRTGQQLVPNDVKRFSQTAQSNGIVSASFRLFNITAKSRKSFTKGNYIKDCLIAEVEEICLEELNLFTQISLSRQTEERRIDSISRVICASLNTITTSFVYFSLALDETSDKSDTAQLTIFIRGIDSQMNIGEELLEPVSLKDTTTGRAIKDAVLNCTQSLQIDLKNLVGIAKMEPLQVLEKMSVLLNYFSIT
ncbi:uncharacterized protein TNIN_467011 [Trichonephila inaurata madagascariensis]|uniref:DUF4371 domain-containing protein n=1 Tax=Trichonephila inaurata madagascariensis TaxID=2747483 RepID=A0A8X6MEY9_9ARAC|nr:uncharacterized protein TNIN_467011 [Trichonephila inaurata madagascariensis]